MTSLPVKNLAFGLNVNISANSKNVNSGGFQEILNKQNEGKTDLNSSNDSSAQKKIPGESMKARDEQRVRTNKREPSRDVEERADISEEKTVLISEVLITAVNDVVQEIAEQFDMTPEEVQTVMTELEIGEYEILDPHALGELVMELSGASDDAALITDENLYSAYQEILGEVETVLREGAEQLSMKPEELKELALSAELQQKPVISEENVIVPDEKQIVAEADGKLTFEKTEVRTDEKQQATEKSEIFETIDSTEQNVGAKTEVMNAGQKNSSNDKEGKNNSHEQGGNLVLQSMKEQQFEPQVEQVQGTESRWDADTQNIMRQIMDYMKFNLKDDVSSMEMQLHPASLGSLQIQLASKGGVITANFITQNETVKAALESQMIQLQEQFEEQGVKVAAIEVSVQTNGFERNLDQGRENNQSSGQEPARKGRIRRINLNDMLLTEEIPEEDRLAADMMAADGNTVDYTA